MEKRWKWEASMRSNIADAFAGWEWFNRLECAVPDPLTGKVLCVCAALGIASSVTLACDDSAASEVLDLLTEWIDDPTVERFDRICHFLFGPDEQADSGPHGIVWCALRTATSSVGNGEAGWALGSVCAAAERAGYESETVRGFAECEVFARQSQAEAGAPADYPHDSP